MLTALISAITGLVSGVVPDLLKEYRESRAHKRETEFLELQNKLQVEREKAGADAKMREAEYAMSTAEVSAYKDMVTAAIEAQAQPSGIRWIDGFNAVLRPATVAIVMVLYAWVSVVYTAAVVASWYEGSIHTLAAFSDAIFGTAIGESFQAIFGFLFGYRSARKK